MIPVFPDYEHSQELNRSNRVTHTFKTRLRKLHTDGRYYLQYVNVIYQRDVDLPQDDIPVKYFILRIYTEIMFSRVSTNILLPDGSKRFILDPDQRSEEERLNLVP